MDKPNRHWPNRTCIATSPIDSKRLIEAAEESRRRRHRWLARRSRARPSGRAPSDPIGTVPPPGTLKGMAKTLLEKSRVSTNVLIASSARGSRTNEPVRALRGAAREVLGRARPRRRTDAHRARGDPRPEHQHMLLVMEVMRHIGADPTAMTPGADSPGSRMGWSRCS